MNQKFPAGLNCLESGLDTFFLFVAAALESGFDTFLLGLAAGLQSNSDSL
jgi:hypothetical protein